MHATARLCQDIKRYVSAILSPLDRAVDPVMCLNTLHCLEEPLPFFNEVARVLKRGWKFVIIDIRRDAPKSLAVLFNPLWRILIREERARDGL